MRSIYAALICAATYLLPSQALSAEDKSHRFQADCYDFTDNESGERFLLCDDNEDGYLDSLLGIGQQMGLLQEVDLTVNDLPLHDRKRFQDAYNTLRISAEIAESQTCLF